MVNCVLHDLNVTHILVSLSSLYDNGHTVLFTKKDCRVKGNDKVGSVGKRTSRTDAFKLNKYTNDYAMSVP